MKCMIANPRCRDCRALKRLRLCRKHFELVGKESLFPARRADGLTSRLLLTANGRSASLTVKYPDIARLVKFGIAAARAGIG